MHTVWAVCDGMNFVTKDRFALNLLIYRKSGQIRFRNIKEHSFHQLFQNYSQTEIKEKRKNFYD